MFEDNWLQCGKVRLPYSDELIFAVQDSKKRVVAFMSGKLAQASAIFWNVTAFAPSCFDLHIKTFRVNCVKAFGSGILHHLQIKRSTDKYFSDLSSDAKFTTAVCGALIN